MAELLDENTTLPIPCRTCGSVTKRSIAQMQQQTTVSCASCGRVLEIDAREFQAAVQRVEFMLHDLGRGLARQVR